MSSLDLISVRCFIGPGYPESIDTSGLWWLDTAGDPYPCPAAKYSYSTAHIQGIRAFDTWPRRLVNESFLGSVCHPRLRCVSCSVSFMQALWHACSEVGHEAKRPAGNESQHNKQSATISMRSCICKNNVRSVDAFARYHHTIFSRFGPAL